MSAGRGWIAVVAVMLGRNNPLYAAAACVLFGFADAMSIHLQSLGLPNQLTDISPYVATLAALVISHRRRTRAARPAAEVAAASASQRPSRQGELWTPIENHDCEPTERLPTRPGDICEGVRSHQRQHVKPPRQPDLPALLAPCDTRSRRWGRASS